MSSLLDAAQYPWAEPAAQQLHVILTQLYPTAQAAGLIASKADVDMSLIMSQQAPAYVWVEILNFAAPGGILRSLVEKVHELLNPNSPHRPFLESLLSNQTPIETGEPRGMDGAPRFLAKNDDVTEPEALLYYDDLTIQIGRVPSLIATLQQLVTLAPAVCRLTVNVNGLEMLGTGFRIGPDLLLTNWHVLHLKNGTRATSVTAEFGYDDDGSGGILSATPFPCDVQSIVTSKDDDWGVIRVKRALPEACPIVKLSSAVEPVQNSPTYIIQHPGGQRKRVGFVRNQVSFFDNRVVHYLTDTQEGSSGSPVFDGQGRLIALHHAGGRPQEVVGRPPLKKNEGIRISQIVAGLSSQGMTAP